METREEHHVEIGKVGKGKEIKDVFLIDSIGLSLQSAVTLYIYRVGKTYPARNPVYRSKSIKNSKCTRTPRPVRPVGPTGQTGWSCQTGQTAWTHRSDRSVEVTTNFGRQQYQIILTS